MNDRRGAATTRPAQVDEGIAALRHVERAKRRALWNHRDVAARAPAANCAARISPPLRQPCPSASGTSRRTGTSAWPSANRRYSVAVIRGTSAAGAGVARRAAGDGDARRHAASRARACTPHASSAEQRTPAAIWSCASSCHGRAVLEVARGSRRSRRRWPVPRRLVVLGLRKPSPARRW